MLCALALLAAAAWAPPVAGEPFADLGLDEALARSVSEGKLLLVDSTASWCPPCQRMEQDTWPDASVRAWLGEHALAIQVDVDEQRQAAQRLSIMAMPTLIAFKAGEEFDRTVGYKDPESLLAWLDGVLAGRRENDGLAEKAEQLAEGTDVKARHDVARRLLQAGDYEHATQEYVWLWINATRYEPSYSGVRRSFVLSEVRRLADAHEPAREAFAEFLAALDAKVRAGATGFDEWADWFSLSRHLDDDASVLRFYEDARDADGRLRPAGLTSQREGYVRDQVFETLLRHGRVVDAGRLADDFAAAGAKIVADYRMMKGVHERMAGEDTNLLVREYPRRRFLEQATMLYRAALAVDRPDDARSVAGALLAELDDAATRCALVEAGLGHAPALGTQLDAWLDEAAALGDDVTDLRGRLDAARASPDDGAVPPGPDGG